MRRDLIGIALFAALLHLQCGPELPMEPPLPESEPTWSIVTTVGSPTARHEAAMVAIGGKGYLMGGRGIKPVEEFDPATGTWREMGPTPLEMHHFQPVAHEGSIYVMTAMTGKYPRETPLDSVYVFDPVADSWRKGPAIPPDRRRGGAGTVVHDGKIYVACGIVDGHTSGTVAWFDEFDPESGSWRRLPDAPRGRDHFSGVVGDGRLYLVGGRDTSYHEPDNFTAFFDKVIPEVDVYDFEAGEWSTLAGGLPVPTAAGGLVEAGGTLYYFGGETSQDLAHSETQRLELGSDQWAVTANLQTGRHGGGAAVLDGRIYVAVGSGGRGGGPELSSTEVLDP